MHEVAIEVLQVCAIGRSAAGRIAEDFAQPGDLFQAAAVTRIAHRQINQLKSAMERSANAGFVLAACDNHPMHFAADIPELLED